jgi:hypothetical protein
MELKVQWGPCLVSAGVKGRVHEQITCCTCSSFISTLSGTFIPGCTAEPICPMRAAGPFLRGLRSPAALAEGFLSLRLLSMHHSYVCTCYIIT